jgi:hypothetical protein
LRQPAIEQFFRRRVIVVVLFIFIGWFVGLFRLVRFIRRQQLQHAFGQLGLIALFGWLVGCFNAIGRRRFRRFIRFGRRLHAFRGRIVGRAIRIDGWFAGFHWRHDGRRVGWPAFGICRRCCGQSGRRRWPGRRCGERRRERGIDGRSEWWFERLRQWRRR